MKNAVDHGTCDRIADGGGDSEDRSLSPLSSAPELDFSARGLRFV